MNQARPVELPVEKNSPPSSTSLDKPPTVAVAPRQSAVGTQQQLWVRDSADEDEDDEEGGVGHAGEETDSEGSDGGHGHDSDDESFVNEEQRGPKLRVREILFYEERVEAFRRRHGVLRP